MPEKVVEQVTSDWFVGPLTTHVRSGPAGGVEGVGVGVTDGVADGTGVPVGVTGGNTTATAAVPCVHAFRLQALTWIVAFVLAVNVVVSTVLPWAAGNGTPLTVQLVVVSVPPMAAVQVTVASVGPVE